MKLNIIAQHKENVLSYLDVQARKRAGVTDPLYCLAVDEEGELYAVIAGHIFKKMPDLQGRGPGRFTVRKGIVTRMVDDDCEELR